MNRLLTAAVFIASLMLSCQEAEFLDSTQTSDLTETSVFADSTYATQFFFGLYENIGFDSDPGRFNDGAFFASTSGGLDGASDEAEPRVLPAITTDIQFATGTVNPVIVSGDAWYVCYRNIRKANQFLSHLDITPFNSELKKQLAAETRFLRAWYYAILLKHYGGVPLVGDTVYTDDDEISAERNKYAECVTYIVAECDAASADLSFQPTNREYGRIGAGACMALKARVLLYAASPLFNGSDFALEEPLRSVLGYPEQDTERWRVAAEAAEAIISRNFYELHVNNAIPGEGFYEEFVAKDFRSTNATEGIILERVATDNRYEEQLWQPPSRGGGNGGAYPYQELVDAFPMANGKPISDPSSGYDPANPYANRDPRFYNTINHDQSKMPAVLFGPPAPIDIFLGSYEGRLAGQDAVRAGTPTGYYVNKMIKRDVVANAFIDGPGSRPLMRYAEVLLNYAEAKNEYDGPGTEVYNAINSVRMRAGLSPYELPAGLSQDEMREVIRNERRIELAFEGHRFFDVRRWMIADQTENNMMTGMEVVRDGSAVSYNRFNVRKHNFRKAMYFWPIPYAEVAKSPELLQNPYY